MFRFAIVILAAIGLGSILFGGTVSAGWLLLAPLFFIFKIMFFVMIFGMFKYGFGHARHGHAYGPWGWRPRRTESRDETPSQKDKFEEWHNLQHARQEVDSWVDPEL